MENEKLIRIKNVSKSFGDHTVLSGLSKDFTCGIFALMGESGIGKTTLLRLIAGLEETDLGEIQVDKEEVMMLFQEDRLIKEFQAYTNFKLFNPKLSRADAMKALSQVCIDDSEKRDVYEIPVACYSGGMCRRVSLLSVVLTGAKILLLDEPFYGLDLDTKCKTMDYLKSQAKDRLILFTTHDEFDAKYLGAEIINLGS